MSGRYTRIPGRRGLWEITYVGRDGSFLARGPLLPGGCPRPDTRLRTFRGGLS